MLSGLSEDRKKKYGLSSAEKYFYLNQVSFCSHSKTNPQLKLLNTFLFLSCII